MSNCKKCLLSEMAEADASKIEAYRMAIKEKDRVKDEEYERRLLFCSSCDMLNAGTCGACGCYVVLRATAKTGKCPHKKW